MRRYLNSYITVPDKDRRGDNVRPRTTEIDAIQRLAYGDPIAATDTIGEAIRAGELRCWRCLQFKAKAEFTVWKKKETGVEYRKRYCNQCIAEMKRTHRFSKVEALNPFPRRLE